MNPQKPEWTDYVPQGKRTITKQGYVIVRCPNHPNANKGRNGAYIFEHRLVMSNHLKRPLGKNEVVHHKNGNRSDNRIENLALMIGKAHMKMHADTQNSEHLNSFVQGGNRYAKSRKKPRVMVLCACGCWTFIEQHDSHGRLRTYAHGHNQTGKHWKWRSNNGL